MSEERLKELEEKVEKLERDKEIKREVERVINNEKAGIFKSILNLMKIIAALILLMTAGEEALHRYPWIGELIK